MPKLTKRTIDASHPKATGDLFVWDDELAGYGLRVKPSGAKSFVLQYRNRSARSRRITLGRYGVLTADQARQLARDALAEVARGCDPAERRAADREALTVAELCAEYFDKAGRGLILTRSGKPKKPSTLSVDRGRAERHIMPLLGSRAVKEITTADLRSFLRDVTAGKTAANIKTEKSRAIVRGGAGTASRGMGLLGAIFTYAVEEGYRPDNPARGVRRPRNHPRKIALDAEHYAALGRALEAAKSRGEPWQSVGVVRLIALTGCRAGEVLNLKRMECDLAGSCLRLADTKTGPSVRPLGKPAREAVNAALGRSSGAYVFPSLRFATQRFTGLQRAWNRLRAAEPSIAFLSPHGLRHGFASTGDDLGYTQATIGSMLGHSRQGTTGGYIHKLDAALLQAADRVAGRVADLLGGKAVAGAEVIELASATAERRAGAM
jgi:integrase